MCIRDSNYAGYYKTGLNVGGIIYAKFGQRFAASMEILYSQKGSRGHKSQKANYTKDVYIQKYGIALNYAEIPLMLHIHDNRKSHFGVGLSFSQLDVYKRQLQHRPSKMMVQISLESLHQIYWQIHQPQCRY